MKRSSSVRWAKFAVCGLLCLPLGASALQRDAAAQYEVKFDEVVRVIRDRFYDPKLHGVDWEKTAKEFRGRLKNVKNRGEFVTLVNSMLDELKASHTEYITDDDVGFAMIKAVMGGGLNGNAVEHIGVMGTRQQGEFTTAGVLEGYPAEKAGIRSGDVLLEVNGKPFQSAGSFHGMAGKSLTLTYRRGTEIRTTQVMPLKENPVQSFLTATKRSIKTLDIDGKKIGYIHLWTMAFDDFRALLENTVRGKLHDTDGLILDLRDGYGGRPWGYADPFFMPDVTWEQQIRDSRPVTTKGGYGKPMVVLINKGTRSAKEFFAYQFKKTKRATLVGTTTAGAFLGASSQAIGNDGLLELAVVGLKVDGKRFEGVGVEPDVVVEPSDTYGENDAQLIQAKTILMDKIAAVAK
jgi:carboxyl-terminal processing protease